MKKVGLNRFDDSKDFIEYSNGMQDVHKNIEEYNQEKKREILIVLTIWLLIWLIIKNLIQ